MSVEEIIMSVMHQKHNWPNICKAVSRSSEHFKDGSLFYMKNSNVKGAP